MLKLVVVCIPPGFTKMNFKICICIVCAVADVVASSILHPYLKIVDVVDNPDKTNGVSFKLWEPPEGSEDLRANEDFNYGHREKRAASNIEMKSTVKTREYVVVENFPKLQSDYIDIGRNITKSRSASRSGQVTAVAEMLVVCDKEFSDLFQHNKRKIIEYLHIYFWDINICFKTLPSVNYDLRINSVVTISTPAGQPFIEEARNSQRVTDKNRILPLFAKWIYQNTKKLPKFDIAILITNAAQEWGGGLAYYRGACIKPDDYYKMHWGTAVFNDNGGYWSATVGAHEIAHLLGAPHDDDPNIPGGCKAKGHIMGGGSDDLRYFFSTCSDKLMAEFASSNEGACLRQTDYRGSPEIDPGLAYPYKAPTMQEQCRRALNQPQAWVEQGDTGNCRNIRCVYPSGKGYNLATQISLVENTQCLGGGNCFRGKCRQPGIQIANVATGRCIKPHDHVNPITQVRTVPCANSGSPLDRFVVTDTGNGKILGTPYATAGAQQYADKCLFIGVGEDGGVWTDTCDMGKNAWHGWDFINAGNQEFHIRHRITGRYIYQAGNGNINAKWNCNMSDRTFRWRMMK